MTRFAFSFKYNVTLFLLCTPAFVKIPVINVIYLIALFCCCLTTLAHLDISVLTRSFVLRIALLWSLWFFGSSLAYLFFHPDAINFLDFFGKPLFILLITLFMCDLYAFSIRHRVNLIAFMQSFFFRLLTLANLIVIFQVSTGIVFFTLGSERAEGLVRVGTPLGAGLTIYGACASLYLCSLLIYRTINAHYYFTAFSALLLSSQRTSVFFFVVGLSCLFLVFLLRLIFTANISIKLLRNKSFLFLSALVVISFPLLLTFISPYISSLWLILTNLFGSGGTEYVAFSSFSGKDSPLWRFYHGLDLSLACFNSNPLSFLFTGCAPFFLGGEFGFKYGDQAHNSIWSFILRFGLLPSSAFLFYSIANLLRHLRSLLVPKVFFLFALLASLLLTNGGLFVNPSTYTLLLFFFLVTLDDSFLRLSR